MAKTLSRRRGGRRGAFATASSLPESSLDAYLGLSLDRPFSLPSSPVTLSYDYSQPLTEVEDRRRFYPSHNPMDWEPAKRRTGSLARLKVPPHRDTPKSRTRRLLTPSVVMFRAPSQVIICIRRKTRKEVIHARGIAGRRVRRGRRTTYSSISCRR